MSITSFKFDINKDIYNIWETSQERSSYNFDYSSRMPQDLVIFCRKNDYSNSKNYIKKYFKKVYDSGQIEIVVKSANQAWNKIEKLFFQRLERLTGKKLKVSKINAFLTLAPRCPYDPKKNTFYFTFFSNLPTILATAGHEMLHLHFHQNYFAEVEREVGHKKAHELKEALTVLLNMEFIDLWFVPDKGYEIHKDLRNFIVENWKSNKNFNKLIDDCILYLKEGENV